MACLHHCNKDAYTRCKIAFDHFHISKYVGTGVDEVRREENRELKKLEILDLVGTKYDWLKNRAKQKKRFSLLKNSALKTARAWAMKEVFQTLWKYKYRTWALKAWKLGWLSRSRLEPMKKVAKTIRSHLWGMINAVVLDVSNGPAESINSRIKMIKIRARGFRNSERLRMQFTSISVDLICIQKAPKIGQPTLKMGGPKKRAGRCEHLCQ